MFMSPPLSSKPRMKKKKSLAGGHIPNSFKFEAYPELTQNLLEEEYGSEE